MRVLLCVSGKWTGIDYTDRLREIVPHDNFYTATYTDCDHNSNFKMDEPEIGYHPVLDTEPYYDEESQQRRRMFVEKSQTRCHYYLLNDEKSLPTKLSYLIPI